DPARDVVDPTARLRVGCERVDVEPDRLEACRGGRADLAAQIRRGAEPGRVVEDVEAEHRHAALPRRRPPLRWPRAETGAEIAARRCSRARAGVCWDARRAAAWRCG